MIDSGRQKVTDKRFDSSISEDRFINKLFERVVAKEIIFKNINFSYCIFDAAYLRSCTFESCIFTGCRFVNSNLTGSSFNACTFDYATFEKTYIDNDVLTLSCPTRENLKLKFARSLRVNYQQLGDAQSANQAINVELRATEEHLYKSWISREPYYRKKYKGLDHFKVFLEWLSFKALDYIWGNGESALKLFRAVVVVMAIIALIHVFSYGKPTLVRSYYEAFLLAPQILLGIIEPKQYPSMYLTAINLVRLVMFGFFMSIIIKRFNRR